MLPLTIGNNYFAFVASYVHKLIVFDHADAFVASGFGSCSVDALSKAFYVEETP
jgi:hypothetical protein